jgi:4-amino-4-deoxy-L-arabinose transferase-like glycosyltransferase
MVDENNTDKSAEPVAEAIDNPPSNGSNDGSEPLATKDDKPLGNPLRMSALLPIGLGAIGPLLMMAYDGHTPLGIPLGLVFILVAAFGVLDLLGTFDDKAEQAASPFSAPTLSMLTVPVVKLALSVLAFAGLVALAGKGAPVNGWLMGLLITTAFIHSLISGYGIARALHVTEGSITAHPGFWLLSLAALLYFPGLGVFSLSDPWETHYGEVAREILARNDWISLWWAQDGFFWSKPILNFWIQALSMGALGTGYSADQMLQGISGPGNAHPEWVVRTPNVLLTLLGMYLLYKGVAKAVNKRAAFIGAMVLATVPDWYFLAHQTMTDMPFVAPMTGAMGLMLLGMNTDSDHKVNLYPLRVGERIFNISLFHVVFGIILVVSIPQILYLASRNIELVLQGSSKGFRVHWDEFQNGSALNCGLPGNEACRSMTPAAAARVPNAFAHLFLAFEPVVQALVWAGSLGALLHLNRGERRVQRLLFLGAWFLAAIATMGKGPVGLVLPMASTFVYVLSTRRFGDLLKFEIWGGILVLACVATPWFVAMYVRHGSPFIDRLFIHDMFNRTLGHVHDTNEGDDTTFRFYIWQLGYALFPWVGLAPLGLSFWARKSDGENGGAATFLTIWFAVCFGLFTFMGTKFHHYIFPAVPPVAMLIGIALDSAIQGRTLPTGKALAKFTVWAFAAALLLTIGIALALPGPLFGTKPLTGDSPAKLGVAALVIAAAIALIVAWFRQVEETTPLPEEPHDGRMFSAGLIAGLFALLLVGRDLMGKAEGSDQPGAIRLLQLFTYNYRRPWPVEDLDFTPALVALTVAGVAFTIVLAIPRLRARATILMCSFGFVAALWGTDVYFVKVSPHWGQRELLEAYYRDRKDASEQVVAYQMNWKGENFYSSNHIPAFVSSGATFTTWLKTQREKGSKVMYFVTEHSRTGGLRSEVGGKNYKEITDRRVNNKFVLVRAEL